MTLSICNHCYKKIPAEIVFKDGLVILEKTCCGERQREVIEKDEPFYRWMMGQRYNNTLGDICNIAITDRCNTSCPACYCKVRDNEKTVEEVIGLAGSAPLWINKFILTGGEPTIHSGFFDIVSRLDCGLITNGIRFKDKDFLHEYSKHRVYANPGELSMMFSLNTSDTPGYTDKVEALENIREAGLKISILVSTITDLEQISGVLEEFEKYTDIACMFKIRSAFNIGEATGNEHIYLSEMCRYIAGISKDFTIIEDLNNNSYLINTRQDGKHLILVKCPDKTTIDLCNIGPTGPYQFTHLDTFEDVMTALIINEGTEKGFFNGKRLVTC